MKISGKQLTFSKKIDVKYSGKIISETDEEITIEGEDEDSYLKVYSPFQGVAKLLTFENDQWVDSEASTASFGASGFDLSQLEGFPGLDGDEEEDDEQDENEPQVIKPGSTILDASGTPIEQTGESS